MYLGVWRSAARKPAPLLGVTQECASKVSNSGRGLYVFKHDSELGNAQAHALVERIAIAHKAGVEVPHSFGDYEVTVNEADLPAGVSLIKRV